MKAQNLLLILFFCFSLLMAEEKNEGKFYGAKDVHIPSWFLDSFLDIKDDIEEQALENKRIIIFVHQKDCPYCNKFITHNLEDKKTKEKIQKHFSIIDVNMFGDKELNYLDGETYSEKSFAKKYKIQFTPTLLFFNEKSEEILRLNGYIPLAKFNLALDYIKNKEEKILSFKNYVQKYSKKSLSKNSIKNKLFINTSKNFRRDKNSKALVIFFEYENCLECKKLHTLFLEDTVIQKLLKNIDIRFVDMNTNTALVTPSKIIMNTKDWLEKLNITYNPSIIFFDNKGKEIIRIESNFKKFHIQSIVDYVVSKAYIKEAEFQRYLTKRANQIRKKGKDVNIWID